ncbi:methyltransferase domain-containing protein [Paenibacillus sp. T1]|uniref:Methyltransferase domain-containing protein n=2 Tax=Paenibacillus glycinis TaxID=2697035 RepID=A0ABW9XKQ3_9BACL|nr:methyltransferase domain-containing protein [Paenibacillus glycinis]
MAIHGGDDGIQRIQTAHRLKLARFWGIEEGDRVLEIGCGQGDTTAVLAYLAGESGFVHGLDVAAPDYGAPITLREAAAQLPTSKLGGRLRMDFETDVLSPEIDFPERAFDKIVLSHCSWYFQSAEQLTAVLVKARKWGRTLCFAEWDARIADIGQYAHWLAALIQAQYESFKPSSLANIRTLFTPDTIKEIAAAAGWNVNAEGSLDSPLLQDGHWEVSYTLSQARAEIGDLRQVPDKLAALVESELALLKQAAAAHGVKPMSAFAFTAKQIQDV